MTPRDVLDAWLAAFNAADVEALAGLYAEGATNHQVADDPVRGRAAIARMFEREFEAAEMQCIPENVLEDGQWVALEWRDPQGFRGCGFFHVVDGRIAFQRGYWDRLSLERLREGD